MPQNSVGPRSTPQFQPGLVSNDEQATVRAQGADQAALPADRMVKPGVLPHLAKFFDTNGDKKITYGETFSGLRRLGMGRAAAVAAAAAINVGLARQSGGSLMTVELAGIAKTKHKGDSGIIDKNGDFVPAKLDSVFEKYSKTVPNALTEAELTQLRNDNVARDNGGIKEKVAALGEFGLLFRFAAEDVGGEKVLTKDTLTEFYTKDTLFESLAQRHSAMRDARSNTVKGTLQNVLNTWIF